MESASDSNVEHGAIVNREEIRTNVDRPPLLSWAALFGGLVFVFAISWLLNLFGLAIGMSIADATDGEAMSNGLPTGAVIWMIVSWLLAFFVGSLFTARLCGKVDEYAGMLHGMALWGLATTILLVLSYWGISGLVQTGAHLVGSTVTAAANTVGNAGSMAGSAISATAATVADASNTPLAHNIQARLKRRAASLVARADAAGGAEVSASEIQSAIDSLSANDLQSIATSVVMGEMTAAREKLADKTNLSSAEVKQLIQGVENEFEQQLGTDDNQTGLATDIASSLKAQIADYVADLDAKGGASVDKADIRQALNEMDRQAFQTVSMRLINGDVQGAKDALAANTNLSTKQINDVVDGVYADVSRTVDKLEEEANQAAEVASTYAQEVLWAIFAAAAMGLAVSVLGGWLGTESSRRIYAEVRNDVPHLTRPAGTTRSS